MRTRWLLLITAAAGLLFHRGYLSERATAEPLAYSADAIARAYTAIPHQQTTYQATRSTLSRDVAERLELLLGWVDRALVERVRLHARARRGALDGTELAAYEQALAPIRSGILAAGNGAEVAEAAALITRAIEEQRRYFASLASAEGKKKPIETDPHVQAASRLLRAAYQKLMASYPNESATNKQAFFDHLCALDFL